MYSVPLSVAETFVLQCIVFSGRASEIFKRTTVSHSSLAKGASGCRYSVLSDRPDSFRSTVIQKFKNLVYEKTQWTEKYLSSEIPLSVIDGGPLADLIKGIVDKQCLVPVSQYIAKSIDPLNISLWNCIRIKSGNCISIKPGLSHPTILLLFIQNIWVKIQRKCYNHAAQLFRGTKRSILMRNKQWQNECHTFNHRRTNKEKQTGESGG